MDFKEATDDLFARVDHEDLAKRLAWEDMGARNLDRVPSDRAAAFLAQETPASTNNPTSANFP